MRFIFRVIYLRHYFYECIARVEIIENKMTTYCTRDGMGCFSQKPWIIINIFTLFIFWDVIIRLNSQTFSLGFSGSYWRRNTSDMYAMWETICTQTKPYKTHASTHWWSPTRLHCLRIQNCIQIPPQRTSSHPHWWQTILLLSMQF